MGLTILLNVFMSLLNISPIVKPSCKDSISKSLYSKIAHIRILIYACFPELTLLYIYISYKNSYLIMNVSHCALQSSWFKNYHNVLNIWNWLNSPALMSLNHTVAQKDFCLNLIRFLDKRIEKINQPQRPGNNRLCLNCVELKPFNYVFQFQLLI